MAKALQSNNSVKEVYNKRLILKDSEIDNFNVNSIDHSISFDTEIFSKRLNTKTAFLKTEPVIWIDNLNYQKGLNIVRELKCDK